MPEPAERKSRGPWGKLFIFGAVLLFVGLVVAGAAMFVGMREVASASRQTFFSVDRAVCDRFTPIETRTHTIWLRAFDSGADQDHAITSIRVTDADAGVDVPLARSFQSELTVNNVSRVSVARVALVEGRDYEVCLDIASPVTQIEIAPRGVGESALLLLVLVPCVAAPLGLAGGFLMCAGGILWLVNR